ncbi:MAG: GNAT family N-acetyltransferase [Caldilinea sp. CFX5]|nr:GNAT family N-acetyltransferase [Caldilinea sp. CFX5]
MSRVIYVDADEPLKARIAHEWGELAVRHMPLADGFSLVALDAEQPIGLIGVSYRSLPAPLTGIYEGYIDIIEVHPEYRRQGIATQLLAMVIERLRVQRLYQIRAWSSEDKGAAIQLWKTLGFTLCPATTYPNGQPVQGYFVARLL